MVGLCVVVEIFDIYFFGVAAPVGLPIYFTAVEEYSNCLWACYSTPTKGTVVVELSAAGVASAMETAVRPGKY